MLPKSPKTFSWRLFWSTEKIENICEFVFKINRFVWMKYWKHCFPVICVNFVSSSKWKLWRRWKRTRKTKSEKSEQYFFAMYLNFLCYFPAQVLEVCEIRDQSLGHTAFREFPVPRTPRINSFFFGIVWRKSKRSSWVVLLVAREGYFCWNLLLPPRRSALHP